MASPRQVVFSIGGVGQLRVKKTDPSKRSWWVEVWKRNGHTAYVNINNHKHHSNPGFADFLWRASIWISENIAQLEGTWQVSYNGAQRREWAHELLNAVYEQLGKRV